jgi:hypothetical protein
VLLVAAPDLAARDALALRPVLAVHLVALGFLPFAVTGAAFHLLPVQHPTNATLAKAQAELNRLTLRAA